MTYKVHYFDLREVPVSYERVLAIFEEKLNDLPANENVISFAEHNRYFTVVTRISPVASDELKAMGCDTHEQLPH